MIEAVNSSLVSAQILRGSVTQTSASHVPVAAPPVEAVRDAPKAPYISPHISIDLAHNKAVLQIRDSETGDVTQQFPTQSRLAQLSRAQASQERAARVRNADLPTPKTASTEQRSAPITPTVQTTDIITVQDVTTTEPSNATPAPQVAAAALSAGAQSAQPEASSSVSVLA